MLNLSVGKLPGFARDIAVSTGTTVLEALRQGIDEETVSRNLEHPVATIVVGDYDLKGQNSVDVPQVNGQFLAEFNTTTQRYENINWNTTVSDEDIVYVLPKEQGAQITVEVRVDGCDSRKVAIYHFGDPEGGAEAGTVSQALSAAGVRLGENDKIFVGDEFAQLDTELFDGDETLITTGEYQFSESAEVAPTEDEILSVVGIDPGELQTDAGELQTKADAIKAEAEEKMAEARRLAEDARAHKAKAEAIVNATHEYAEGLRRLEELGVDIEAIEPVPTVIFGSLMGGLQIAEIPERMTLTAFLAEEEVKLQKKEVVVYNDQILEELEDIVLSDGDSILVVPITKNGRWIKMLIAK